MPKFILLIFGLVICACTTIPLDAPIKTSISEIYKDPWAYDGKLVRVRGTFDECASFTCQLCETEDALKNRALLLEKESYELPLPNEMCMSVSFYDDTELVHYRPSDLSKPIAKSTADQYMEKLARFTTSTIDAIYSAHCSRVPFTPDLIPLCTDRASQLDRAKIVQTHIRRSATIGVINIYGRERLIAPDATTTAAISLAFNKSRSAQSETSIEPNFIYLVPEVEDDEWLEEYNVSQTGGACICNIDKCQPSDWPKRWGDATHETPANPYQCWYAEEVDGVWRFPAF